MSSNFSFGKNYRLITKSDFQNLKIGSHFFSFGYFLFFVKTNNLKNSRLGIAVSKKYGNAVRRNRLKRIIRNEFRLSAFKNVGTDILVVPNLKKLNKEKPDFLDVESNIKTSLNKAMEVNFGL